MAKETVGGKEAFIHFDGKRCIHARNCVLGHADVFVPNVQAEWIRPDTVSAEEVAFIARQCPSGAIQYERLDGQPGEPAPVVNTVRIRKDGPLALNAPLTVGGEDIGYNSHDEGGFVASGGRSPNESQPLASRNGDRAAEGRSAEGQRQSGNRQRHRPHIGPLRADLAVPLLAVAEQPLLRWLAPEIGIRRRRRMTPVARRGIATQRKAPSKRGFLLSGNRRGGINRPAVSADVPSVPARRWCARR